MIKAVNFTEVLRGMALAFLLRSIGAALAFLFNVVVARMLGAEGAGLFFLSLSVTMIASVIARLGMDNALLRLVAVHASRDEWGSVKGVFALTMKIALISSTAWTALCFFAAPWMANNLFSMPDLAEPLRWMSFAIVGFSMMMLLSEGLKGLRMIRNSMLVSGVFYPLIGLMCIWPMVALADAEGASATYVVGTLVAAALGWIIWRKEMAAHDESIQPFDKKELKRSSQPLYIMSIVNNAVLPWAPLFILGIWSTAEETGVFGAASRIAVLISLVLVTVNTVLAPRFAELYDKQDYESLALLAKRASLLITLIVSPVFIALILFSDLCMSIFGDEFRDGGVLLAILAIGRFVNTLAGPAGVLLMMSKQEVVVRDISLVSGLTIILLCLYLAPIYGALGVAVASSIVIAGSNLASVFFVWKRMGFVALPGWK